MNLRPAVTTLTLHASVDSVVAIKSVATGILNMRATVTPRVVLRLAVTS